MTTTTTTTSPPQLEVLEKVETVEIRQSTTKTKQDASDSKTTLNTIDSESLNLGPIAPGETSDTKIIYLRIPKSIGIANIKIALIDAGGIIFDNSTFGVETLNYLDYNTIPSSFFEGVNSNKDSGSAYNVSIPNNGALSSQYVYLNVTLPNNSSLGAGTIRYKWFFDYDSGVSSTVGTIGSTIGSSVVESVVEDPETTTQSTINTYIVSGSSDERINGRYTISGNGDYVKEGTTIMSAGTTPTGTQGLNLFIQINNPDRTSLFVVDYNSTNWCPSCGFPIISTLWTYRLQGQSIENQIEGTYVTEAYAGTGTLPTNPYTGNTFTVTASV